MSWALDRDDDALTPGQAVVLDFNALLAGARAILEPEHYNVILGILAMRLAAEHRLQLDDEERPT